jgi:probable HAF family extracellular repeat protein
MRAPILFVVAFASSGASAAQYDLSDLGPVGFAVSAFNAHGAYVGQVGNDAALVRNGAVTDLGFLFNTNRAAAEAINDAGQIVGTLSTIDYSHNIHAFIWENGVMSPVDSDSQVQSAAHAINASGVIAGDRAGMAAIWDHGTVTSIGALPHDHGSTATAINAFGDVAGVSQLSGTHAFFYRNGVMTPAGDLDGYGDAQAWAINDAGDVAGSAMVALDPANGIYAWHAYVWREGVTTDLGSLGDAGNYSEALAINNAGVVVGMSAFKGYAQDQWHAFIDKAGAMLDLNDVIMSRSGWILRSAEWIDDSGRIAGTGWLGGQMHAYVLTPKTATRRR